MKLAYKTKLLLAACLFVAAGTRTGNADVTLAFDPTGAVVEFNVNVGETVEIPVYLIQTGTPVANGDLTVDGIISMGIQLEYDFIVGSAIATAATQDSAFFDFQETVIDNAQGRSSFVGAVGFFDPAAIGTSVLLGTFSFQGTTGGNVTMISIVSPGLLNTPGPYYVSGSNPPVALDGGIFPSLAMTTVTTNNFLLGDVNLDGVVNLLDVQPFVQLLSSGQFQVEADIDQNGVVNLLDVNPFVAILSGG